MDIEFHYYMTFLIAGKAGFGEEDTFSIAYASQYVDDNDIIYEIHKDKAQYYRNYISQTMNIMKPKPKLFRIYPLFHFIPGDPLSKEAFRKDGVLHWLNTTPDSENAKIILDSALRSRNNYRIGIATHSYVDTWAHQNFIGYYNEFNSMSGVLQRIAPNIGHADAGHNPDWPGLVWEDKRLLTKNSRIDNKERFMKSAASLFTKYRLHVDKKCSRKTLNADRMQLIKGLRSAIGEIDQSNANRKVRIERYKELSQQMLGYEIPEYDEYAWFEEAVNENVRGLRDKSDSFLSRWDPLTDIYTWRKPRKYKETNWYKFQEAVKLNQNTTWDLLDKKVFSKLDLKDL
ncbi:DUF6765 family protein [Thermodesulfobacteriota bacterium]